MKEWEIHGISSYHMNGIYSLLFTCKCDAVCFHWTSPKWCFFSLLFKWIYLFIAFSELDIIVFPIFCFRYLPAFCWKILLPCHCMHPKYDKYGISAYYSIVCAHSHSTAQQQGNGMDDKNKVKKETVRRFSRVLWVKNMCWPNDIRKRNKNKTATVILFCVRKTSWKC